MVISTYCIMYATVTITVLLFIVHATPIDLICHIAIANYPYSYVQLAKNIALVIL